MRTARKPGRPRRHESRGAGLTLAVLLHACASSGGDRTDTDPPDDAGTPSPRDAAAFPDATPPRDATSVTACDGSEGIRLAVWASGSFVDSSDGFQHAFGHDFLRVDGRCAFWAGRSEEPGAYVAGSLDDIDDLVDLRLDELSGEVGYLDPACGEGDTFTIWWEGGAVRCCNCEEGPDAVRTSYRAAQELMESAYASGRPANGPLKVLLVAEQDGVDADTAWPLADVLAVETPGRDFDQDDGVLVEDARDVAALRILREIDPATNDHPGLQLSLEGSGVVVDAYLRDVLSEAFEVAID